MRLNKFLLVLLIVFLLTPLSIFAQSNPEPITIHDNNQTLSESLSISPILVPASFACNCGLTCAAIQTCEEAYYQLTVCGCTERDLDNDGIPCESLCSGQNVGPIAENDTYETTRNTVLNVDIANGVLANDVEFENQALTATVVNEPNSGSLSLNQNGSFTYIPENLFIGEDTFTYKASDGLDESTAIVTIQVNRPALVLSNPKGTLTDSLGNPSFSWKSYSSGYQLYIAKAEDITAAIPWDWQLVLNEQDVDAVSCAIDSCFVRLTEVTDSAWLANGNYQVWLHYADDPLLENWYGPFLFSINTPAPAFPTFGNTTGTDTLRPTVNFTLEDNAVFASWFQVYLAPSNDLANPIDFRWVSGEELCGFYGSTDCSYQPAVDLAHNVSYDFYIQSWGPGGITTGGIADSGWSEPVKFKPFVLDFTEKTNP